MTERPLTQKHVQLESEGHFRQISLTGQNPTYPSSPLHPHPTSSRTNSSPIPHPPAAGTHGERRAATDARRRPSTRRRPHTASSSTRRRPHTASSSTRRRPHTATDARRRPHQGRRSDDGRARVYARDNGRARVDAPTTAARGRRSSQIGRRVSPFIPFAPPLPCRSVVKARS
jgi:hypothetical protein